MYIFKQKNIFEEINQNSKNNLGIVSYDCFVWFVFLYIFLFFFPPKFHLYNPEGNYFKMQYL